MSAILPSLPVLSGAKQSVARIPAYGVFSSGIDRIPHLGLLLDGKVVRSVGGRLWQAVDGVVGWGRGKRALQAQRYAQRHGLPYLSAEDGFLRSVGLGRDTPPLSVVVDDLGIYFDAGRPSRLEQLIAMPRRAGEMLRARALVTAWREGGVSKYNHQRDPDGPLPERYVLVVDQTAGDASIRYGNADADSFQRMLDAALEENPDCTVLLKLHPEVVAGHKCGHYDAAAAARPRVQVLAQDVHPAQLLAQAQAVYVVTSQLGFEALLWGRPVRTFGMPFYAGWGLTADELPAPGRRAPVSLEQLVYGALVDYPRYVDPESGRRCTVEDTLAYLALQRRMRQRYAPVVHAVGFSPLKLVTLRRFMQGSEVRRVRHAGQVPPGGTAVLWGIRHGAGKRHTQHVRVEDGFLRSVGLGADLVRPLSWALDSRGIYYDAGAPSDLEHLLRNAQFDAALCRRAARLRERIIAAQLTKYNVGGGTWRRPIGGRVILVPGQVESDASLHSATTELCRNMELLRAVRAANPDAWVVYKPHPDVAAGLRSQGYDDALAWQWCNEVVADVDMGVLFDAVDEVHVLTSLCGFEALLRGKRVTTYGMPFYAGWGLTDDRGMRDAVAQRRGRTLSLDELTAGVLIQYPTYVSRRTGNFITPEQALDQLLVWRDCAASTLPWWRRALRPLLRLALGQ